LLLQREVGDDDLGVVHLAFLAVDALGAGLLLHLKALIQLVNHRVVVVGQYPPPLHLAEDIPQRFVAEPHAVGIGVARGVGRVAVEEVGGVVVLGDEFGVVEVLDHDPIKPAAQFPHALQAVLQAGQSEEFIE